MLKFVIIAHRSRNSVCGFGEAPLKDSLGIMFFNTEEQAREEANKMNKECQSPNVRYSVSEWWIDDDEVDDNYNDDEDEYLELG